MLTFPLRLTIEEIAALPGAAENFGWDDDDLDHTLEEHISDYLANGMSEMMKAYFTLHGYDYNETGCYVRSKESLIRAQALFTMISFEYDECRSEDREELYTRFGYTSPLWYLFGIGGGDDYVDYYSTQPSCLVDLLLRNCEE